MKIISKNILVEDEINKSRFITYLQYVESPQEAKDFLKQIKDKYPDATHHVSVYITGSTGEQGHASDDGEPSGTAAMPIMDVFKKNDVTNFICIVVRYFGGIKLGAGGLVRAYSSSASHALKESGLTNLIKYQQIELSFDYDKVGLIDKLTKGLNITNKIFDSKVIYTIKLPEQDVNELKNILINSTNNQIEIK